MNVDERIVESLAGNDVSFVTTVPCKQLAGVIARIDARRLARRRLPWMVYDYVDGALGLARVVDVLAAEADIALAMLGRRSVGEIERTGP